MSMIFMMGLNVITSFFMTAMAFGIVVRATFQ